MMASKPAPREAAALNGEPEPVWEIAHLFPPQGCWDEEDYLALDTNWLVEFTDGTVEVLPMPTLRHQRIALYLYRVLWAFVSQHNLGEVLVAPLRVRLRHRLYCEPDVIFLSRERVAGADKYPNGADLAIEVVSPDNPGRDYERKRREYASAGIPEYWIVDPQRQLVTVLTLDGSQYKVHGEFTPDQEATSVLLAGFAVNVLDLFAAAQ